MEFASLFQNHRRILGLVALLGFAIVMEVPFRQYKPSSDERVFDLLLPSPATSEKLSNHQSILICTMLSDDFHAYVHGAIRLASALPAGIDSAIIEISERPIPADIWMQLKEAGWQKKITVSRIAPRNEGMEATSRFQDQFSKLHLWNSSLLPYDIVLYMDSDVFVLRSLHPLLLHITNSSRLHTFFAAEDIPAFPGSFNMGLFAVRPSEAELKRLLHILRSDLVSFPEIWAEQGFLNVVYDNQWNRLPVTFSMNLALWSFDRKDIWNTNSRNAQILHFTMIKPWNWWCPWTQYAPLCYIFWNKPRLQFHRVPWAD